MDRIFDIIYIGLLCFFGLIGFAFVAAIILAAIDIFFELRDGVKMSDDTPEEENEEQMEFLRQYNQEKEERSKRHAGKQAAKLQRRGICAEADGDEESEKD